jgi:hypothetical protein
MASMRQCCNFQVAAHERHDAGVASDCNLEQPSDQMELAHNLTDAYPSDLPLPNRMHGFVTLDRAVGSPERAETLAGSHAPLDCPMILFNGLITNDKFCLSRVSRQKLRYARRPRTLPCQAVILMRTLAMKNVAEVRMKRQWRVRRHSADHECRAAVGPGLPTGVLGINRTENRPKQIRPFVTDFTVQSYGSPNPITVRTDAVLPSHRLIGLISFG